MQVIITITLTIRKTLIWMTLITVKCIASKQNKCLYRRLGILGLLFYKNDFMFMEQYVEVK